MRDLCRFVAFGRGWPLGAALLLGCLLLGADVGQGASDICGCASTRSTAIPRIGAAATVHRPGCDARCQRCFCDVGAIHEGIRRPAACAFQRFLDRANAGEAADALA